MVCFLTRPSHLHAITLKAKAKERSLHAQRVRRENNKKQSDTVKRLCKEWKEQQGNEIDDFPDVIPGSRWVIHPRQSRHAS
jgi:hypothetical protein